MFQHKTFITATFWASGPNPASCVDNAHLWVFVDSQVEMKWIMIFHSPKKYIIIAWDRFGKWIDLSVFIYLRIAVLYLLFFFLFQLVTAYRTVQRDKEKTQVISLNKWLQFPFISRAVFQMSFCFNELLYFSNKYKW